MEEEARPILSAVSYCTEAIHFKALTVDNFALIVLTFFVYFTITVALDFNKEDFNTIPFQVSKTMVIILIGITSLCCLYLIVAMLRSRYRTSIKLRGVPVLKRLRCSFHHTWKLALTVIIGTLSSLRYGKKISLEMDLYNSGIEQNSIYVVLAVAVLTFAIIQIILFSEYFFIQIFSDISTDRFFHISTTFYATTALAITSNTAVGYELIREELLWTEFQKSWFYLHPFDIEFCLLAIAFWVEVIPHKKDNCGHCHCQVRGQGQGYGSLSVFETYPLRSCTSNVEDSCSFNDDQLNTTVDSDHSFGLNSGSGFIEPLETFHEINIDTDRPCWAKHLCSVLYRETFKKPTMFFIVLNTFLVAQVFIWLTLCVHDESDFKTQIPLLLAELTLNVVVCIIYFRFVRKLEDLKISNPLQPDEMLLLICVIIFNAYFVILAIPDIVILVRGKVANSQPDTNVSVYSWLEVLNKTTGPAFNLVQIKILLQLRRKRKSLQVLGDTRRRNFWLLLLTMLTANMTFWIWNCFRRANMCGSWFYDDDYKSLWSNVMRIVFPVAIFYRFHSSIVLVELMHEYYQPGDHAA
ncbi:hypothetical protein CHS0354_031788 [Potamilus streckersoni]|uniref:Uncharacterized protein n=1 Tax=Potamilus streckersoni TaxID=2493646 RepID=A0AAE0RXN1_9BIVA|nr:hypothetical protein CHS0354_031788 [Potamilus streckersoni]